MRIKISNIKNKYDFVIVGAGIAGISILRELLENKRRNILVIEAGTMHLSDTYPSFQNIYSTNLLIKESSRFTGVGGSSNVWGSLNGLFDEAEITNSFKKGCFPFSYDDYIFWLRKAGKYGFPNPDQFNLQSNSWKDFRLEKFIAVQPNIKFRKFASMLEAENIDFVQKAILRHIEPDHRRNSFKLSLNINAKEIQVAIKTEKLILTCGTLQSIKILGSSNLKNTSKLLGLGYMNHPKGIVGAIFKKNTSIIKELTPTKKGNFISHMGVQARLKRKNHFKHCIKFNDGLIPPSLNLLKDFINNKTKTRNIKYLGFFYFLDKILNIIIKIFHKFTKNHFYSIEAYCSMASSNSNKVTIKRNSFDLQVVDYKLSEPELSDLLKLIDEIELKVNKKILFRPRSTSQLAKMVSLDASHHLGGLSIGTSQRNSVLNKNLSLHGYNNLYVCSLGILPFSNVVNPTISLVALSIWFSQKILMGKK